MKRKITQAEFGFYLGDDDCFIVNPNDFKIFKLYSNNSTLLTNQSTIPSICNFNFQIIPEIFNNLDLMNFTQFLNGEKSNDIDFKLWMQFLDYLHAKDKYAKKLKVMAEEYVGTTSDMALLFWKLFKIKCTNIELLANVPKIKDNIEFFADHNYFVLFEEKYDNQDLHCPTELLNLLDKNHTILITNCVMPNYVYNQYDRQEIVFLQTTETIESKNKRVDVLCKLLVDHNYILTRTVKSETIYATPPPNSKYLLFELNFAMSIDVAVKQFYETEQCCIVSLSTYMFSASAYCDRKNGIVAEKENICDYYLLQQIGIKIKNPEIIDAIQGEREISESVFIQNPNVSLLANKIALESYGTKFYEILQDNYKLF